MTFKEDLYFINEKIKTPKNTEIRLKRKAGQKILKESDW